MFTSLVIGAAFWSPQSPRAIPVAAIAQFGFALNDLSTDDFHGPSRSEVATFLRSSDRVVLTVSIRAFDSERRATFDKGEEVGPLRAVRAVFPKLIGTPSQTPLGTDVRHQIRGGLTFYARTSWEQVQFNMRDPRPRSQVGEEILPAGEAIARYCLAALAEKRTGRPAYAQRAGLSGQFAVDERTQVDLIRLADWAVRRGWAVRVNEETACAIATKGSHTVLVPLAAKQIKINGAWTPLSDIVRRVGDDIYVPLDGLKDVQ